MTRPIASTVGTRNSGYLMKVRIVVVLSPARHYAEAAMAGVGDHWT
jgi:hypothetical protein